MFLLLVVMLDRPCSDVQCKAAGYPLHSHLYPSLPLLRVTMWHHVLNALYIVTRAQWEWIKWVKAHHRTVLHFQEHMKHFTPSLHKMCHEKWNLIFVVFLLLVADVSEHTLCFIFIGSVSRKKLYERRLYGSQSQEMRFRRDRQPQRYLSKSFRNSCGLDCHTSIATHRAAKYCDTSYVTRVSLLISGPQKVKRSHQRFSI